MPDMEIRSPSPENEGQFPPPHFTEAEHQAAREEGCADAYERWRMMCETNQFINSHERMYQEAKEDYRRDLESIGLPPEVLGAVAKAANRLPADPDFHYPSEINVPRDAGIHRACIEGMYERLEKLYGKLEDLGISPGTDPYDDVVPLQHRDRVRDICEQIRIAEERLGAFGVITSADDQYLQRQSEDMESQADEEECESYEMDGEDATESDGDTSYLDEYSEWGNSGDEWSES